MSKAPKTMLTVFVDTELKKDLIQLADIADEGKAMLGRNRKGVSGIVEPVLAAYVKKALRQTEPEEDAA